MFSYYWEKYFQGINRFSALGVCGNIDDPRNSGILAQDVEDLVNWDLRDSILSWCATADVK